MTSDKLSCSRRQVRSQLNWRVSQVEAGGSHQHAGRLQPGWQHPASGSKTTTDPRFG
jgi:hypothetical protein